MDRDAKALYELRGRTVFHRRLLQESKDIIAAALCLMRRPYVAFSCGKDSSTLAHLVLQFDKTVPLRFLSSGETRLVHNADEVIDYFKSFGADIQEINIDRVFSEEWKNATWDEQRKAGRGDLHRLNEGGWDGVFMGLRGEESKRRRYSLWQHQTKGFPPFTFSYKRQENFIRCCPLARWRTEDVGAYLLANGIPFLEWYEHAGSFDARTTARITGDAVRQGMLVWLKKNKPDSWNKLLERFPEFGLYV